MEVKRLQQWFMDGSEAEMFPNKKQALGDGSGSSFGGVQPSSVPSWGNAPGFSSVSTPLNERLFDTDTIQNINFDERNVPPVNTGHLSTASNHFGNFTSFGLSMSHSPEPSLFSVDYGGIRKVKVSEVRDSENLTPISIGPSRTEEAGVMTTTHDYSKVDNISKVDNSSVSMVLTYGGEDATVITLGDSFGREEDNFLSTSQTFRKGDFTKLAMGYNNEADSSIMPMSISLNKSNVDIISTPEDLCKGDNSVISIENPSKKDDEITPMRQAYNGDNCVSESNNFNYKVSTTSMAQSSSKCQSHGLSVSHPLDKGESNIISFGGGHYDANTSGRLMCSYNLPMRQTQSLDTHNPKDFGVKNTNPVICTPQGLSAGAESASKRKEDHKSIKKIPSNNFPSNVRSLLSTGILDDVPVKYTAWSREVLRGIIKGSGYLCGCQACNFSKVINAYEFERHAGCKTKHPNNHIYFDNGKTIYGVVQELRSTPQNMLFDILQTITGSPINQKSFRLWKESYLAATRELQRIYGKDERKQLL